MKLADLTSSPPPPGPADWNADGVIVLEEFFDNVELREYAAAWTRANVETDDRPHGWPDCTPYMRVPEMRRLLCDEGLARELEQLVGQPMGLHLVLSGWRSTRRRWHQDAYLNPPSVGDAYAAVWIALNDIEADSGPFQYVPGSHRWPQITRDAMGTIADLSDPDWPWQTEDVVADLFCGEIERRDAKVVDYLPKRGDVLIWHSRLLHQGSVPMDPDAWRPALIAHYSGIYRRPDMPLAVRDENGGWLFPLQGSVPVGAGRSQIS